MTESCKKAAFDLLQSFTDDQLEPAIKLQALLNKDTKMFIKWEKMVFREGQNNLYYKICTKFNLIFCKYFTKKIFRKKKCCGETYEIV